MSELLRVFESVLICHITDIGLWFVRSTPPPNTITRDNSVENPSDYDITRHKYFEYLFFSLLLSVNQQNEKHMQKDVDIIYRITSIL